MQSLIAQPPRGAHWVMLMPTAWSLNTQIHKLKNSSIHGEGQRRFARSFIGMESIESSRICVTSPQIFLEMSMIFVPIILTVFVDHCT